MVTNRKNVDQSAEAKLHASLEKFGVKALIWSLHQAKMNFSGFSYLIALICLTVVPQCFGDAIKGVVPLNSGTFDKVCIIVHVKFG